MTLPLSDGSAAGVLALDAGFYEFIPEEWMDAAVPPVLLAHEVEMGRRYGVVLSSANGLYRYDLNDVVEVRGAYRRTPLVAFVRKGRDMTSITGYESSAKAGAAVRERRAGVALCGTACPGRRRVPLRPLVEPGETGLEDIGAEAFARGFDEGLSGQRRVRRGGHRLGPAARRHAPGWAERQCQAEFARGAD